MVARTTLGNILQEIIRSSEEFTMVQALIALSGVLFAALLGALVALYNKKRDIKFEESANDLVKDEWVDRLTTVAEAPTLTRADILAVRRSLRLFPYKENEVIVDLYKSVCNFSGFSKDLKVKSFKGIESNLYHFVIAQFINIVENIDKSYSNLNPALFLDEDEAKVLRLIARWAAVKEKDGSSSSYKKRIMFDLDVLDDQTLYGYKDCYLLKGITETIKNVVKEDRLSSGKRKDLQVEEDSVCRKNNEKDNTDKLSTDLIKQLEVELCDFCNKDKNKSNTKKLSEDQERFLKSVFDKFCSENKKESKIDGVSDDQKKEVKLYFDNFWITRAKKENELSVNQEKKLKANFDELWNNELKKQENDNSNADNAHSYLDLHPRFQAFLYFVFSALYGIGSFFIIVVIEKLVANQLMAWLNGFGAIISQILWGVFALLSGYVIKAFCSINVKGWKPAFNRLFLSASLGSFLYFISCNLDNKGAAYLFEGGIGSEPFLSLSGVMFAIAIFLFTFSSVMSWSSRKPRNLLNKFRK